MPQERPKKIAKEETKKKKKKDLQGSGVPIVAQELMNPSSSHEDTGLIPGLSLSGLRIQRCCELWRRLQMRL